MSRHNFTSRLIKKDFKQDEQDKPDKLDLNDFFLSCSLSCEACSILFNFPVAKYK
jgi:hypothetical protein